MKIKNLFSSSKSEAIDSRCLVCGLDEGCLSPRMPVSGKGEKSILILGEAPGKLESEKNTQWVGKAGQFLRKILKLYDINIDRDCWKTNAVACRPTKGKENRKPTKKEITFCRYRVLEAIKKYKPKYIMLFGGVAIESTLGYLFPKLSISKIHGYVIPIQEYNAWVLPIYHPSFVMRNEKDENLQSVFKRDIKNASDFIKQDREVPQYDYVTNLDNDHLLLDIQDVRSAFKQILKTKKETAFDYETTGTKPFIEGQKITSMAISTEFGTYAFPVDYQTHWNDKEFDTITNLIIEYLTKDSIYKVAHNAKFEKMWSQEIFGTRPKVDWCTMDTQHIIDHRRGVTSLKFQAFIRWGIHGYDRLSKAYIKSGSGSSFNRMDEMPLGNQLLYVSLDAKLTRELFFEQKKQITKKLEPGRKLFLSTSDVFLDMQMNGLVVDEEHYKTSDKDLTEKIDKLTKQIAKAPEVLKYNKGSKKTFSETSPKDLQELLFNQMKIVSTKKTAGGGKSVDAEVLKDIDHQIPRDILLKRKYLKLRDTYLAQFLRECTDGFMHPNFTLNMARSLRSSCGQPSFQNIPKRDKESNLICRKGIIPSVGCRLIEADFCFTGDTLIETNKGPIPILDIVNSNEQIYVYCYNQKKKRIGFGKIIRGRKTQEKTKVRKITLDNNKVIKCTPEHKFMLRDGTYKEAQKLTIHDSLMPLYKKIKAANHKTKYYQIRLNQDGVPSRSDLNTEHGLLGKDILKVKTGNKKGDLMIHHKDGDGLNNDLSNLEVMTREKHFSIHSKQGWKNNSNRSHWQQTPSGGKKCSQNNLKRNTEWSDEKWKEQGEAIKKSLKNRGGHGGKNNPMFDKAQSAETKKYISDVKLGLRKKKTHETCKICGQVYKNSISSRHLKNKHNITLAEYRKEYNHKIKSIENYGYEDTYNITVEEHFNYALSAGVIVKNSGIEVSTSAIYHKDPVFINYLISDDADLHRDLTLQLWGITKEQITKELRFFTKNCWVFPQFYGDFFGSCANALWKMCVEGNLKLANGTPLITHLRKVKMHTLEFFTKHCQDVEDDMWNRRFKVYTEWKDDINDFYQRHGFVETFFGFQFTDYLNKRQATNYPIQSTATHLLFWCLCRLQEIAIAEDWRSCQVGQIHDSQVSDTPDDEVLHVIKTIDNVCSVELTENFEWIDIPMKVDFEISKLREDGGNFAGMEEYVK